MLTSMTGCGTAEKRGKAGVVSVSVKALNGKLLSVAVHVPREMEEKEWDIRKMVLKTLKRGVIHVHIGYERVDGLGEYQVDDKVLSRHFDTLRNFAKGRRLTVEDSSLLAMALRLAGTRKRTSVALKENVWRLAKSGLKDALLSCEKFREHEGLALCKSLQKYLRNIERSLERVASFETKREEKVRERLGKRLEDHLSKKAPDDRQRFEQEVLYYMERGSFEEEKVRLWQNLASFSETLLHKKSREKGKKLLFIAQEIGREINTLGDKSNYHDIEKEAVDMKVELEKIKEQLQNVL